jgi:hypothetical protein
MITVGTDTYLSLADARTYVTANGLTPLPLVDAEAESLLKRATTTIDRIYGAKYLGSKEDMTQPLAWPRLVGTGYPHSDGESLFVTIDSDGNPRDFSGLQPELGQAETELAVMLQAGVDPYAQPDPFLSMERNKVSALEQEKQYKGSQGYRADPLYKIGLILRPILELAVGSISITRGA